jgi:hypothetical protein
LRHSMKSNWVGEPAGRIHCYLKIGLSFNLISKPHARYRH